MANLFPVYLFSALLLACNGAAAADPVKSKPVAASTVIPQYKLRHDPKAKTGEVCQAFLKVLNSTPYEVLYQDIFLDVLKGKEGFEQMNWQHIEDGEQKYGEMPIRKIEMLKQPHADGFRKYKESVGGFDYYLSHGVIFHDVDVNGVDIGKELPIILYVNKSRKTQDKRNHWDYVVAESDMSSPSKRAYMNEGILSVSDDSHIFKYKGNIYIFSSLYMPRPYVIDIYHSVFSCSYELMK